MKMKVKDKTPATPWLPMAAGCVVVVIIAAILGLSAEKRFGSVIYQKLPPSIVAPSVTPSPSIAALLPSVTPLLSVTPSPSPELTAQEYILPFSDTRAVTTADLTGLTSWELKVARNEIYARHGRPFIHKDLSCYFAKQSWYILDPDYSDESLSKLELTNANTVLDYEKSIASPLIAKDTGCQ